MTDHTLQKQIDELRAVFLVAKMSKRRTDKTVAQALELGLFVTDELHARVRTYKEGGEIYSKLAHQNGRDANEFEAQLSAEREKAKGLVEALQQLRLANNNTTYSPEHPIWEADRKAVEAIAAYTQSAEEPQSSSHWGIHE